MGRITIQDERGFNQLFAPVGSTPLRARRRADWFAGQAMGARRVLEIGCGTGETAAHVAGVTGAEVVAIDLSASFLAEARERHSMPNLEFVQADLLADGWESLGRFDLVMGNGILHHLVAQLDDVLARLRLTVPQGRMAFIEPNLLNPICLFLFGTPPGRRWGHLEPDEMAFTPWRLQRALGRTGWREARVAMRDFLLPGLPEVLIRPSLFLEPALEATVLTSWMAQSHFVTARA